MGRNLEKTQEAQMEQKAHGHSGLLHLKKHFQGCLGQDKQQFNQQTATHVQMHKKSLFVQKIKSEIQKQGEYNI